MQTDAFRRLKFELCEYLRLYGAGLKKRANAHLKGAVCKFKSEFSEGGAGLCARARYVNLKASLARRSGTMRWVNFAAKF